jgi:Glycosyl transferases group 1
MDIAGRVSNSNAPVVLVVGFSDSVHTARWVNAARGRRLRIVILPVYSAPLSAAFGGFRTISSAEDLDKMNDREVGVFDLNSVSKQEIAAIPLEAECETWRPVWLATAPFARTGHVVAAIRRLRPAIVHSMVVQFGGYLAWGARNYLADEFPAWVMSNWGSDIYLFQKTQEHAPRIRQILSCLDAYHAECERDMRIARQLGFRGFEFPVMPASGGMRFADFPPLDSFERPSVRKDIYIKGYHGWAGRGLHTLAAVHMAADALRGYTIRLGLAEEPAKAMAETIAQTDGLDLVVAPYLPDHKDALLQLAKCRFVAGLGIADGISTTLLEAMAVGTFPILGCGSCGNEWIVPDDTGILVSPHDVAALAAAMRRAASDDEMVDSAAGRNRKVVETRWNTDLNGPAIAAQYHALLDRVRARGAASQRQYAREVLAVDA